MGPMRASAGGSSGGTANGVSSTCGTTSSLAAEAEKAFQERHRLEEEMESIASFLTSEGMPGLRGSLVDEEGFPRADIDVHAVREARHRLACLHTDYREAQRRLEQLLLRAHAETAKSQTEDQEFMSARRPEASEAYARQNDAPPPLHEDEGPAFAVVDVVQPDSPSSAAGLACGDRVLRLGSLRLPSTRTFPDADESLNGETSRSGDINCSTSVAYLFERLPGEVGLHEDERMPLVVQRGDRVLLLWLVPRKWKGRGLLGCHLKPLQRD